MHAQPELPRNGGRTAAGESGQLASLVPQPYMPADEPPGRDRRIDEVQEFLGAVRHRAEQASSWADTTRHLSGLVNRDGVVPVSARLTRGDLDFLTSAREDLLRLARAGLQLVELHQPLDADGVTSDPYGQVLRCRSCMWRWPCPTLRALGEALGIPAPR
jgi:hypothetical protein